MPRIRVTELVGGMNGYPNICALQAIYLSTLLINYSFKGSVDRWLNTVKFLNWMHACVHAWTDQLSIDQWIGGLVNGWGTDRLTD